MIKQIFNKPQKMNQFVTRQVDPMELFWDLIFVVTLRYILDAYIMDFSLYTFTIGLLLFLETYLFWINLNVYNVNYYNVSHNNRMLMTLSLMPLLLLASITDFYNIVSIYTIGISLFLLNITQAYFWYRAIRHYKNSRRYNSINFIYKSEVIINIITGSLFLFVIVYPSLVIPILVITLILELLLPNYLNRNREVKYNFDRILIAERFLLFIILIFGEGFIGVIHILQEGVIGDVSTLIRGLIVFWTLYVMFLKLYDEYTIHKEKISTTFMIFLTTYVIGSMLMVSSLVLMGMMHESSDFEIVTVTIMAALAYFGVFMYTSARYLKKRKIHLTENDIAYYKKDIMNSIISIVICIASSLVINNVMILLMIYSIVIMYNTHIIKYRSKNVSDIFRKDHKLITEEGK